MSLIEDLNFTREEVLDKLCERVYRNTFGGSERNRDDQMGDEIPGF